MRYYRIVKRRKKPRTSKTQPGIGIEIGITISLYKMCVFALKAELIPYTRRGFFDGSHWLSQFSLLKISAIKKATIP